MPYQFQKTQYPFNLEKMLNNNNNNRGIDIGNIDIDILDN